MITEKHVEEVSQFIYSLPQDRKIIIGIEGYSGTGKSTLLTMLAQKEPELLIVHRDDFLAERTTFQKAMKHSKSKEHTIVHESLDIAVLRNLVDSFKNSNNVHNCILRADHSSQNKTGNVIVHCSYDCSKRIMIIEGIFLFHPDLFDDIFDYRILLETDQEAADERRRVREKARWGDKYMPDTHPDSYFRLIKIAYNEYLEKYQPKARADLVVEV